MKTEFLLLTVITFVKTQDVVQQNPHLNSNAIIRQLFEMLKYFVKNGSPGGDFPILDPLQFEYRHYEYTSPKKAFSLEADFKNNLLSGLSNFEVLNSQFFEDDIAIELNVNFPHITFKSENYKMTGAIYEAIPIGGKGKFEFDVYNFTFSGMVFLKQSDDKRSILIKNILHSKFSIHRIASRIDFDKNIDDIANAVITDVLANYLTRFNQFIIKTYIDNLIKFFNQYLNNFDSWRILATLL